MSTFPARWGDFARLGATFLLASALVSCRSPQPSFYTEAQAARGAVVYEGQCSTCHQAGMLPESLGQCVRLPHSPGRPQIAELDAEPQVRAAIQRSLA